MSSDFPSIIHHGTASALDGSPSNENQLGIWALDFSTSTNVPLAMKVTCHSGRGGLSQRFSPTCDSSPFPRSYGVLRRGQVLGLFLDSSIRSYTLHLADHWLALCIRKSSPTYSHLYVFPHALHRYGNIFTCFRLSPTQPVHD